MKTKFKKAISLLLTVMMLLTMTPMTAFAYWEEPSAEGNIDLETTVYDYTKPVGVTMQRLTGNCVAEFGEDGNLGDDFLFVIKSGDRYYAMKDVPASETAYNSIPAVDVTDWVNADGTLTVPADTLGVAFMRYEERYDRELGMFINGREDYLTYTYGYESVDGDTDHYNDAERIYFGAFKIRTFEIGQYINNPGYWSENGVSGTMQFGGGWSYYINSYNSIKLKYELITDLRDDSLGGKAFYFRYLGTDVEFVGDEVEGYLYYTDCRHQGTVRHAEYDAPTCMLKGCEEYWYCENCNRYAKDENFTEFFGEEMPVLPATGHDFDNEKCANCNRPVPVYSKVTNQADFDALADDTMFILVAEYNGKHYAMDFSEVYSYMTDSDGDGFYDIHDVDDDSDGIPDYLEFDGGGGGEYGDEPNGVYDYLEWDMDDDGDVDDYDLREFHIMVCNQHLTDMLYTKGTINATEITINSDGTISHEEATKTAEFEMVDVYLAEDYNPEWHSYWENGEMPYHTKCVKQFVIPNYFLSAPSMRPIERMYQQRIYDFGDSSHWGVLFYDSRDQYFSYTDGDLDEKVDADEDGKPDPLPFPDVSKEGSVAVFDTFDDIMWILYDEGQMAQLRLRDYNGTIEFVTGHDYELEGWEWVDDESYEDGGYYDTHDTQACVYLYVSEGTGGSNTPPATHTCTWTDWYPNSEENHKRDCMDDTCDKFEIAPHEWDNGVITTEPTEDAEGIKTYTCTVCRHTKTEPVDKVEHECTWTEWYPNDDENHKRECLGDNCGKFEIEKHNLQIDVIQIETCEYPGQEYVYCETCGYENYRTRPALEHAWGNWTEVTPATETTEGLEQRVCSNDNTHVEKRVIPMLSHTHDIQAVNANPATCSEPGNIACYQCSSCQCYFSDKAGTIELDEDTVTITALGHDWSDWSDTGDNAVADIHERSCVRDGCDAKEIGNHVWSGWINDSDTNHKKTCSICSGTRIAEHQWDEGKVITPATQLEDGWKVYTCEICKLQKDETIPKLDVPVDTTPVDNAAGAVLDMESDALINNVLTEEEQTAVNNGTATVSIYLQVEDISDKIAPDEAAAATNAAADKGAKIGMYLDIDLHKAVTASGQTVETQIRETNGKITITIVVPDELINTDSNITRVYSIVRVHEGYTEIIFGEFDAVAKTFTFDTDKFSTYAFAYNDQTARNKGDVNLDGSVNMDDVVALLNHVVKAEIITDSTALLAGEVTNDTDLNMDDVVKLLNYVVKAIDSLD